VWFKPESLLQKPSSHSEHLYSLHNWDAPRDNMITVLLANYQVTAFAFSDETWSPSLITSTQATNRRSKNILDRTISTTRSPLVAKSCQTKAQAGHKAEESYSNPFQELSVPNYSPCQQCDRWSGRVRYLTRLFAFNHRKFWVWNPAVLRRLCC
jgi:hypothetical protein